MFEKEKGSSETIREVSFQFNDFDKNLVLHKKKINHADLEWLIGFTEGNNSFIVSTNSNYFQITQNSYKILNKIKKILGFGSVTTYKSDFKFTVADKAGVFRLLCLFNGNLLLNKTNERFKLWLANYNLLYSEDIQYKGILSVSPAFFPNNKWLSGLIDADGWFYGELNSQNDYRQKNENLESLSLILFIDQDAAEKSNLDLIAKAFEGKLCLIQKECDTVYRARFCSKASQKLIIQYLSKNKLLGDKHITYSRWKRLSEVNLALVNKEKLMSLCKSINQVYSKK